jgi:ligand-binding sensor domain-containing protein
MVRNLRLSLAILLMSAASLCAQTSFVLGDWIAYSSMRTVRSASVDSRDRIWCATSGGVSVINPADGTTREFRNVDALLNIDVTAIHCDPVAKVVYIGSFDGSFAIVTEDFEWTNITDIRRASAYQRKQINDFHLVDSTLFIATDFGILNFDPVRRVFRETIDRIGTLQEKTPINALVTLRDTLWAATDSGIVAGPMNVSTMRVPERWRVYSVQNAGLTNSVCTRIDVANSEVIAVVGFDVMQRTGDRFTMLAGPAQQTYGLTVHNNEIFYSVAGEIRSLSGPAIGAWPAPLQGHTSFVSNGTLHHIGYVKDRTLGVYDGIQITMYTVNSPQSNIFTSLGFDRDGRLWAASYAEGLGTGAGASVLVDGTWTNLNVVTTPEMRTDQIYRVSPQSNGTVWLGSWGKGAYECRPSESAISVVRWDETNSDIAGISNDASYTLVSDVITDRFGNLWMCNEQSADRLLVKRSSTGEWSRVPYALNPRNNRFRAMANDFNNTKWLGGFNGDGLVAYNDRNTAQTTDDVWQALTSGNTQLPDNVVNAVRVDRLGAVWIGTAKGVAVITNPGSLSNATLPFVRRISEISAVSVNDIHVDAVNNKWVATTNGVFVLNSDGTEVLATVTMSNSPLAENNVRSVTVDERTGRAYFGTTSGMFSVATLATRALDDFDLRVFPQPFRPSTDQNVVIDGLAADSDVRILSPSGVMVHALQATGRTALWDGTDTNGNTVPPGVYIVVARSTSTGTSATGKIAVKAR